MKSIIESINNVNESGSEMWEVLDGIMKSKSIARFNAPKERYMWIFPYGGRDNKMAVVSLDNIIDSIADPDDADNTDIRKIKSLRFGESYTPDGQNIYVRII